MSRVGQTNLLEHVEVLTDRYMVLAEQFSNPYVLAEVRKIVPLELVKDFTAISSRYSIPELVKWFQLIMKWNKDENLKRFNHVLNLLRTRDGRCGEWAILFTAVLCSLDYTARIVLDFEDHVWTEVWLDGWVHVDSTLGPPNNFDHPFIYQDSFKHQIIKILAFQSGGVVEDVTERYRH